MRAKRATMDRRFFGVFGCVFCRRLGVGLGIGWGLLLVWLLWFVGLLWLLGLLVLARSRFGNDLVNCGFWWLCFCFWYEMIFL
jgi:hypothetical protein